MGEFKRIMSKLYNVKIMSNVIMSKFMFVVLSEYSRSSEFLLREHVLV